jgi:hypothetical protein
MTKQYEKYDVEYKGILKDTELKGEWTLGEQKGVYHLSCSRQVDAEKQQISGALRCFHYLDFPFSRIQNSRFFRSLIPTSLYLPLTLRSY